MTAAHQRFHECQMLGGAQEMFVQTNKSGPVPRQQRGGVCKANLSLPSVRHQISKGRDKINTCAMQKVYFLSIGAPVVNMNISCESFVFCSD